MVDTTDWQTNNQQPFVVLTVNKMNVYRYYRRLFLVVSHRCTLLNNDDDDDDNLFMCWCVKNSQLCMVLLWKKNKKNKNKISKINFSLKQGSEVHINETITKQVFSLSKSFSTLLKFWDFKQLLTIQTRLNINTTELLRSNPFCGQYCF